MEVALLIIAIVVAVGLLARPRWCGPKCDRRSQRRVLAAIVLARRAAKFSVQDE